MLLRILLLTLPLPLSTFAQEWKSIPALANGAYAWNRQTDVHDGNRLFKVNPYNGSIWCVLGNRVHGLDADGDYFHFDYTNSYVFEQAGYLQSRLLDIAFTSTDTYVCDRFNGITKFNGTNWSYMYHGEQLNHIHAEGDTIFTAFRDVGNDYLTWVNNSPGQKGFSAARLATKNGKVYASHGVFNDGIFSMQEGNLRWYYPDNSEILDFKTYDFKFSPVNDTFFVASKRGVSMALDGVFFDSITASNSWGMPYGVIAEIEIDSKNNIWALFGELNSFETEFDRYVSIAYFDRSTNSWQNVFTPNNSPLECSHKVSIELGPFDNLYIADNRYIHIVKFGDRWPVWMDAKLKEKGEIQMHPNPTQDLIHFIGGQLGYAEKIVVRDELQREVEASGYVHALDLSHLAVGTYWVEIWDENDALMIRKRIVKI
ncbi:MAG: hypothetical protein ACFHU9_14300 [Fluviicola sp.]